LWRGRVNGGFTGAGLGLAAVQIGAERGGFVGGALGGSAEAGELGLGGRGVGHG